VSDAPVAAQNAVVFHRFTGLNRHSLRNGFTAYFVLSPVTGFVATVAPEKRELLEDLTPASGRQDHTTSPYATDVARPAHQARATSSRPPHPVPTLVTMADAPLPEQDGVDKPLIWVRRQVYF
jgi:hypothetical protein